jgi:hypothetical protein
MKRTLIAMVVVAAALVFASADEGLQTARVVSIKNHLQGRIGYWEGVFPSSTVIPSTTSPWTGKTRNTSCGTNRGAVTFRKLGIVEM